MVAVVIAVAAIAEYKLLAVLKSNRQHWPASPQL